MRLYARDFGLPLALIGTIFLIGRVWDAALDPMVGILSDRTRCRWGRRRPWIAVGGLLFSAGAAGLFFPPAQVAPSYFAVMLFTFYLGWTAIQVPYMAWAGEVSGHYHQRTRIMTYQLAIFAIGQLLALALPTLAGLLDTGDGRSQLAVVGGLIVASTAPALFLTFGGVGEPPSPARRDPLSLRHAVSAIARNPLLLRILASDFAVTAAQAARASLVVFFVTFYMGRPEWATGLILLQYAFGVFAGPIWLRVALSLGKHRAAFVGELAQAVTNLTILLVTPDRFAMLLALTVCNGLLQGSGNLMLRAIVADVADQHRLKTGEDRTGLYFSIFSLAGKSAGGVAVGIVLPLVAWLGFAPAAGNSDAALTALKSVFALAPALAHLLSAMLVLRFPLDEAAHDAIKLGLTGR